MEHAADPLAVLPDSVPAARLTDHVLLVGYGRVGSRIGSALIERGIPLVVAEDNRDLVEQLRGQGIPAVCGDATDIASALIQGHVARARLLVVAVPDPFAARRMLEIARMLKPDIRVVVRTHSSEEADLLRAEGADRVFIGENELADAMVGEISVRMAG